MLTTARAIALGALGVLAVTLGPGCQDLREYAGDWSGELSADPALAHGFAPGTTVNADVSAADRDGIAFVLTLDPDGPAAPAPAGPPAPFVPIRRAAGDILGEMQLPGEPLRTFVGFVQPPGEQPYLAVVSLYPENRLELRLIRGADEAYGVFSLRRVRAPAH